MARPTTYTPEAALQICARLADGHTLREICRDETMPSRSTVHLWLLQHDEFSDQYARAREDQADTWGDEIVEIADNASNDWMMRNHGDGDEVEVPNHDHISRSKLRIEARKWLMGKAAPKKYGDRVDLNLGGEVKLVPSISINGQPS